MDILNIRSLLRTKSIYDIPLRVTFYAHVSSDTDINSLDNQISYYEEFIQKNKQWTYVPGYIDEGLSGISTKKRKHFNEMIADAKDGAFDLIITKEISRFARNTLDSLQYTRELLGCGVGVYADLRQPSFAVKGRRFSSSSLIQTASLASRRVKKCSFRNAARIHVEANLTVPSAWLLSLGCSTRAGTIAVPQYSASS